MPNNQKMIMKTKTLGATCLMLTAATLAGTTLSARADDNTASAATSTDTNAAPAIVAAPDADAWQFGVTVPAWIVDIDGNVTAHGHQQDINIDFNTLREHLDSSFGLGLNVNKGKFGMYTDFSYMRFSGGLTGGRGVNASIDLKFFAGDGGVSYLLFKTENEHPFLLVGTAGLRYWYTDTSIHFTGPNANPLWSGGKDRNLVDPVIGLRGSQYLTRKLHVDFAADGGGFNISHHVDWTWSAAAVASYDFCKWFTLSAGYQAVAIDESDGGGTSKNGLNLIFNGAVIAAKFKF